MRALIGLGSNQGERLAQLRSAVRSLVDGAIPDTRVVGLSRVYETRPVGPSRDPYLNAALAVETGLDPHVLLSGLKAIEDAHGRIRADRWGPRTLDLDLLLAFDHELPVTLHDERLELPHPEVLARDFVMRPLLDLDPELKVGSRRVQDLLDALPEHDRTILRTLAEGLASD